MCVFLLPKGPNDHIYTYPEVVASGVGIWKQGWGGGALCPILYVTGSTIGCLGSSCLSHRYVEKKKKKLSQVKLDPLGFA